jgi:hypothetical protein
LTTFTALQNSSFLDLDSYRTNAPTPTGTPVAGNITFNVALVLQRVNDPTNLLNADWGSRQQQIAALDQSDNMWSTYGADQASYNSAVGALGAMGISTVAGPNGYVASAANRTIWVNITVDPSKNIDQFSPLFGTPLLSNSSGLLWAGNLSLPTTLTDLGVQGVWFDDANFNSVTALSSTGVILPNGPQSIGNSGPEPEYLPNQMAEFYHYPLTGALWDPSSPTAVKTGPIGLIEPGIGAAINGTVTSYQAGLDTYRQDSLKITTPVTVVDVSPGGETDSTSGERSLDAGVATGVNPQSALVFYAGSGNDSNAYSGAFSTYQQAIWAGTGDAALPTPKVVSSSYGMEYGHPAPGSPFLWVAQQLFVDAALRNMTMLTASDDGGSSDQATNGETNVDTAQTSPYEILVGGTSQSTLAAAEAASKSDPALAALVADAKAQDRATLWQLIAGGMTELPSDAEPTDWLVETVWNQYQTSGITFDFGNSYYANNASTGGVDPSQLTPWYQTALGFTPTTSDPGLLVGRGVPDVAGPAGGHSFFTVPEGDLVGTHGDGGTSAATPFWASLIVQINAVFKDQGLPELGYMNDLLYMAAAIAPASFNDVSLGNNISSFTRGGAYTTQIKEEDGQLVTLTLAPTGYGYQAGEGYDQTTGLGSPDGSVLARTLSAIGHSQMYFGDVPDVLGSTGSSATAQTLLIQTMSQSAALVGVTTGAQSQSFISAPSASFAWNSGMAGRSEQSAFDAQLVQFFDAQGQGTVGQATVTAGDAVSVSINGVSAQAVTSALTNSFGFVDFQQGNGPDAPVVRLARPVAIAETALAHDEQMAVVRLRQDGMDDYSLMFYRVDDLSGSIGALHPGDAGYASAANARAYHSVAGGSSIEGPGYGNYDQTLLEHVNAGDIIAMKLTDSLQGHDYWAFSQANELVAGQNVGHLWNYGLNTWGWEDGFGGGDKDYNDMVVSLDFTSTAGHGYLVNS